MEVVTSENEVVQVWQQVDWLTMTATGFEDRKRIAEWSSRYLKENAEVGHRVHLWHKWGYDGFEVAGASFGWREQDTYLKLSSDVAAKHWVEVGEWASNCSRIDLAVTVRLKHYDNEAAARAFRRVEEIRKTEKLGREYTLITSLFGGDTLYVGKRASSQFGRLYNKGAQKSGSQFDNTWRYEVEFKGALAQSVLAFLLDSKEREAAINSLVYSWFNDRLISPIYNPTVVLGAIQVERSRTDIDKKLSWFREQVAPSIKEMERKGKLKDAVEALGLADKLNKERD